MTRASALALAAALQLLTAQQRFRSGVDLVRVDALVTDGRRPISGLTATDFELRDNGVVQTIDSAELEGLPLSVIFVLDISGSVAGGKMANLSSAVDLLLKGLRAEDRAALVTFSHRVWVRTPLVPDFASLRAMLSKAEATGGTSLYDAVYAGLALSDVQDSRPLLVVFSDGLDNASWMSAEIVENAARRANAVVHGVAVAASTRTVVRLDYMAAGGKTVDSQPEYQKGQTDFLDSVASATGGRLLKADAVGNLPRAFDDILRECRTRYLITYQPHGVDAAGWHRIDVKVTPRSAHVMARAGYQR
jgi:VWFA-related protein